MNIFGHTGMKDWGPWVSATWANYPGMSMLGDATVRMLIEHYFQPQEPGWYVVQRKYPAIRPLNGMLHTDESCY